MVEDKQNTNRVTNSIRKNQKYKTTVERTESNEIIKEIKWQTPSLENSQIKRKPRLRIWNNYKNIKY